MKKLLCLILALLILSPAVFAESGVTVIIDGEELISDVGGEIISGRTFVPLRAVAEKLGAQVEWNNETRGITLRKDSREINLTIGSLSASITSSGKVTGAELDAAPYIKDGRTMVPLRFIAQGFGRRAVWSSDFRAAVIAEYRPLSQGRCKELAEKYFSELLPQAVKLNGAEIARDIEKNPQNAVNYFYNIWTDQAAVVISNEMTNEEFQEFSALKSEDDQYEYLLSLGEKLDIPLECPVRICPLKCGKNFGILFDGPGDRKIDASPLCIFKCEDGAVVSENLY